MNRKKIMDEMKTIVASNVEEDLTNPASDVTRRRNKRREYLFSVLAKYPIESRKDYNIVIDYIKDMEQDCRREIYQSNSESEKYEMYEKLDEWMTMHWSFADYYNDLQDYLARNGYMEKSEAIEILKLRYRLVSITCDGMHSVIEDFNSEKLSEYLFTQSLALKNLLGVSLHGDMMNIYLTSDAEKGNEIDAEIVCCFVC